MSIVSTQTAVWKKKFFLDALHQSQFGTLRLTLPGREVYVIKGREPGLEADMVLYDLRCIDALLQLGDIGLGETYMKGLWATSDLPKLLTFFVQNIEAIEKIIHGKRWIQFLMASTKWFTKNSRRGSKKNIFKHYDLGNDFYSLWLDNSLTYSSALFENQEKNLEQAQLDKYDRILNELNVGSGKILEIGCGWGGFSEIAGKRGHQVEAITISKAQAEYAIKRMKDQGLDNHVKVQICDYRDVQGEYDGIVSIEMFEAVGAQYWGLYFDTLHRSLKKAGRAIIQTITISDHAFEGYKSQTDFIQKHIFPGGILPSNSIFNDLSTRFGFNVSEKFSFGSCYAQTLTHWLQKFDEMKLKIERLGFDDEFIRKWRFYLSYCIAGFATGRTDVVQYTLEHRS
ncbi:MAG: cyclopropane-fatty-acyl-phospholipid synthase family protein [Alphaproteobacteria bacterium]|nr:cyclopropane-fatty-acyl-phospholipid synthase family protein [Alphaproteobacteria bacterium]